MNALFLDAIKKLEAEDSMPQTGPTAIYIPACKAILDKANRLDVNPKDLLRFCKAILNKNDKTS